MNSLARKSRNLTVVSKTRLGEHLEVRRSPTAARRSHGSLNGDLFPLLDTKKAYPMDLKSLHSLIRDEVTAAAKLEAEKCDFRLSGRGHEPRVTLDRKMAGILKRCAIPRVTISGFGANNFYPKRVFEQAKAALAGRLGWSPISRAMAVG